MTFFRSIRFRIAAWNSLAVAAVAITALIGLRQTVRWTLNREVDQVLDEDAREVGLMLSESGADGLEGVADQLRRKSTGHAQHQWFVRLLDSDGRAVWVSALADSSPTPEGPSPLQTIGDHRLRQAAAPDNPLRIAQVQLGASLAPLRGDLRRIDRIAIGASAMLLVVSPLCGYWLAGLATRDLAAMTAQAARLRPSRLDERLPERGVGDELDRLARTVNRLLDRIAAFIREKRQFLADAAHELRTPIAAIRSSAEVALARERTSVEYRELLEELIEDSESLEVLVNQLLLLSEATASEGAASTAPVCLTDVARKSIDMFSGVAETRGVRIASELTQEVFVDGVRQHLMQVVNNLLDNALKYTQAGGRVEAALDATQDGRARLCVRDTGLGIDAADIPYVFDRFFRADRSRARDGAGGSGLGLSICRSIVEAYGGSIRCESTVGVGTVFEVTFPLARGVIGMPPAGADGAANITSV